MADDQEGAVVAGQRVLDRGDGVEVQVVGGLVEDEQLGRHVAQQDTGERGAQALACVLLGDTPPQLLILDEPTNDLDLDSIEAVEAALSGYDGALLVVSHDRDFLAAIGIDREVALA